MQKREELKENPPPSENEVKATKLLIQEKGEALKNIKSATATEEELCGPCSELMKAKENLLRLEERFKLKTGIPRRDGKVDYSQDFFARQAYLTVSGQLQDENFACALSSIYTFGLTFEAEHSHTLRLLAEFWMVEPEIAFAGLEDDMNCAEAYVKFLCQWLLDHCLDDMQFMVKNFDKTAIDRLKLVSSTTFMRISYSEAVRLLKNVKYKKFENEVEWGVDLASEHERYLGNALLRAYKQRQIVKYPKYANE